MQQTTKGEKPLTQQERNLLRRVESLTKQGSQIHDLKLVVAGREMWLSVNGGKLERLGDK